MGLMIKELLNIATVRLTESGCMTPKLDAEVLFFDMMKLDRSFLFAHAGSELDDDRCEKYFQRIDERAGGTPVQYITGWQEFMGLRFEVNEAVLIPRPDTEILVEQAIEEIKGAKKRHGAPDILDLCCGSGAIAVSLAHFLEKAKITACDLSKEALAVAKENASNNQASSIKFVESDLFSAFKASGIGSDKFHMIVSNPPYIPTTVIGTLQREITEHEPMMALDGGDDGLGFYRRIVSEAPNYLKKDGQLLLEIGYDQAADLVGLLAADGRYEEEVFVVKDLAGHDRVIKARIKGKEKRKEKQTDKEKLDRPKMCEEE